MRRATLLTLAALLAACGEATSFGPGGEAPAEVEDGELSPPFDMAGEDKDDAVRGVSLEVAGAATEVWAATERWSDRDTAAARKAGMAWGANSGLTWEEKYAAWVDALPRTTAADGRVTFQITTPYGRTLEGPVLECSEVALFLRSTFASWYGLPFFVSATDAKGKRVYLGHFGWRTDAGKYGGSPDFKTKYRDHGPTIPASGWPSDAALRQKALGDDAREAGLWFDDLYLNKRMGWFQLILLNWFGSMNLADEANAFHLEPEAVRPGDILVERWQRHGIGHVLLVKSVIRSGEQLEVTLASGSMPRRQPVWEDEVDSKRYFTSEITGGVGETDDGIPYAKLGGGLRRMKQAIRKSGRWHNAVPAADASVVIPASDLEAIAARPARFEELLSEPTPEAKKAAILRALEAKRQHLRAHPASCSARIAREELMDELKALLAREGMDADEVDAEFRTLEDYVLAELSYARSKTCCWNPTDAGMFEVVMDYARKEQEAQCVAPTVFRSHADGYERWARFAAETGRAWKAWSEDELCEQRDVAEDAEAGQDAAPYCELSTQPAAACTDALEPNDGAAREVAAGVTRGLAICDGDVDRLEVKVPAGKSLEATIRFDHADGDLDLRLVDGGGARVDVSESTADEDTVRGGEGRFVIEVYGYGGATNGYELEVVVR